MSGLSTATPVFAAPGATIMRREFEGPFGLVCDALGENPPSGQLVCFANRDRALGLFKMIADGPDRPAGGGANTDRDCGWSFRCECTWLMCWTGGAEGRCSRRIHADSVEIPSGDDRTVTAQIPA